MLKPLLQQNGPKMRWTVSISDNVALNTSRATSESEGPPPFQEDRSGNTDQYTIV